MEGDTEKSLSDRLEAFKLVISHIGKNKKLIIEDDTCLGRILEGFRTLLKNGFIERINTEDFFPSLFSSCHEAFKLKSISDTHMQFLVSVYGLLCSNLVPVSTKLNTNELVKIFIEIGRPEGEWSINVLNSWLVAFKDLLTSASSFNLALEMGFHVSMISNAAISTSIFVSRNAIKILASILITLYENKKKYKFEEHLVECVKVIGKFHSIDCLMQIAVEGMKKNFDVTSTLKTLFVTEDGLFGSDVILNHCLESAQTGSAIFSNFIFCYFTYNCKKEKLPVSEEMVRNFIIIFLCSNPLKEVGYRILSASFRQIQRDFTIEMLCTVFDVYLNTQTTTSSSNEDVRRWAEVLTSYNDNRVNVTKIVCCSIHSISQIWNFLTADEQTRLKRKLSCMLGNCYEVSELVKITCVPVLFDNEKVSIDLLRNLDFMEQNSMDDQKKCCICYGGVLLNIAVKISKTRIYSCKVVKHTFSILLSQLKRICGQHLSEQNDLIEHIVQLYVNSSEGYSEWELKDEGFECMTKFFKTFSRRPDIVGSLLGKFGDKIVGTIITHMKDPVNYVRASALSCARSLLETCGNKTQVLLRFLLVFLHSINNDGDEIARRCAVELLHSCIQSSTDEQFEQIKIQLMLLIDDNNSLVNNDTRVLTGVDEVKRLLAEDRPPTKKESDQLWTTSVYHLVYLTSYDLDIEVRCKCLDVILSICKRSSQVQHDSKTNEFISQLCRDSNTTVSEHAILMYKNLYGDDSSNLRVRSCFDADMEDFDSLLDDVTFRIMSSYTALCTHHGADGGHVDEMGETENILQLDCY